MNKFLTCIWYIVAFQIIYHFYGSGSITTLLVIYGVVIGNIGYFIIDLFEYRKKIISINVTRE